MGGGRAGGIASWLWMKRRGRFRISTEIEARFHPAIDRISRHMGDHGEDSPDSRDASGDVLAFDVCVLKLDVELSGLMAPKMETGHVWKTPLVCGTFRSPEDASRVPVGG